MFSALLLLALTFPYSWEEQGVKISYLSNPADFPVQVTVGEQAVGLPLGR